MKPEDKAKEIAGISPKANVNNQRFENRCMYVAAMYMYKWVKKRAIKIVLDYLYSKVEDDKTSIEQEVVEEIKQKLKKEL